jgi:hypothetical protein
MQASLWTGCAAAVALAGIASFAERRRNRRVDLDKVGFMPWPLVSVLAIMAAVVLAAIALQVR